MAAWCRQVDAAVKRISRLVHLGGLSTARTGAARLRPPAPWPARAIGSPPALLALAFLDETGFRARFAGSPVKRIGRDRFVRNVLIAIGNSGDPSLAPAADRLRSDPDPTVAEAADWAVRRLERSAPAA